MFGNPKKANDMASEKFETILGPLVEVEGNLKARGSIRVDGRVVGDIDSAPEDGVTVVVGVQGRVEGDITAKRVMVAGQVHGNVQAVAEVELLSGSVAHGNIRCASISVAHGAKVHGQIHAEPVAQPIPAESGTATVKLVA
jgi:cytoskeletal protein CcmA (bactofilin family)